MRRRRANIKKSIHRTQLRPDCQCQTLFDNNGTEQQLTQPKWTKHEKKTEQRRRTKTANIHTFWLSVCLRWLNPKCERARKKKNKSAAAKTTKTNKRNDTTLTSHNVIEPLWIFIYTNETKKRKKILYGFWLQIWN